MEKIQPQGVFFVGLITGLTALLILLLAYLFWSVGPGDGPPDLTAVVAVLSAFGILFLVDAALVFLGARVGYYLSMASWILLFFSACYEYYNWNLVPVLLYPILYSILCLTYFSRKNVRTYFGT